MPPAMCLEMPGRLRDLMRFFCTTTSRVPPGSSKRIRRSSPRGGRTHQVIGLLFAMSGDGKLVGRFADHLTVRKTASSAYRKQFPSDFIAVSEADSLICCWHVIFGILDLHTHMYFWCELYGIGWRFPKYSRSLWRLGGEAFFSFQKWVWRRSPMSISGSRFLQGFVSMGICF